MGAEDFTHHAAGESMTQAFNLAQEDARYNYGHAGYTGTIAEKESFKRVTLPEGVSYDEVLNLIFDAIKPNFDGNDPKNKSFARLEKLFGWREAVSMVNTYDDKWGPCIGMEITPGRFVFAGIASS